MAFALAKDFRHFRLRILCSNCFRESERLLELPVWQGAPQDADELLGSNALETLRYRCKACGSLIGQLVSVEGGDLT